ncbi:MAG: vitamin K epoxide reductase family protein [Patescibacteria group bacterium]
MTLKVKIFAFGVIIVGLLDSFYLFYKYINANPIDCFLFDGCNTIAQSPYSHVFGIPLPTFGVLFYVVMFLLVFFLTRYENILWKRLALLASVIGFIFSLYFVYLQGFVIQAFCIYCLISAIASTLILCLLIFVNNKKTEITDYERKY